MLPLIMLPLIMLPLIMLPILLLPLVILILVILLLNILLLLPLIGIKQKSSSAQDLPPSLPPPYADMAFIDVGDIAAQLYTIYANI